MTSGARARALLFGVLPGVLGLMAVASACGSNAMLPAGNALDGGLDGGDATVVGADGGTDAATAEDVANTEDALPDLLVPPSISRDAGEGTLGSMRQACAFEAGAWPAQTIGDEYPIGTDIPVNHVIVIVQENRSFDHYLGRLVAQGYYQAGDFTQVPDAGADSASEAGGDAAIPGSGFVNPNEIDVPPAGWSNPDGDGGIIVPHPDDEYCYGVGHSWGNQHDDWDNGMNDKFVITNNPGGERTLLYEDDTVIPFYYALASTFSVGDRYFCSVLSSTWPNRFFLMAGTSFGIGDNSACTLDTLTNPAPNIFHLLEAAGHSWKDYTDGPHMEELFPSFGLSPDAIAHYGSVGAGKCTLFADIQNDTLPDVSFMMGDEVTETSDEGPSDLPGIGGQVVEAIIRALWASSSWRDTAVFITYDENGGIADHVPPPPACEPDRYPAHDVHGNSLPGAFNTTGFRVPFIVVSPYAKAHFASHTVHDHTSILRFIEARFGLPALTARDANAAPPMEMFDFKDPPFMTPPTISAHTTVPPSILSQCGQSLAPTSCP